MNTKIKAHAWLDETLLLEVLVRLAIVDVTLLVFQFFHCLLLENFISTFSLELLGH